MSKKRYRKKGEPDYALQEENRRGSIHSKKSDCLLPGTTYPRAGCVLSWDGIGRCAERECVLYTAWEVWKRDGEVLYRGRPVPGEPNA